MRQIWGWRASENQQPAHDTKKGNYLYRYAVRFFFCEGFELIFWVQNVGIWRIWGLFLPPPLHPLGPRFSWQFGIQILLRRGIEAELLRLMLSRLVRFACVHQSLSPLVVSVHLTQGTNSTSIRGRKFNQRSQILHSFRHSCPHEIFALRKLRILRVFLKFHGGLKMSKKRNKYRFRVPPQMRRTQKN